jgi:hypothetical protein
MTAADGSQLAPPRRRLAVQCRTEPRLPPATMVAAHAVNAVKIVLCAIF